MPSRAHLEHPFTRPSVIAEVQFGTLMICPSSLGCFCLPSGEAHSSHSLNLFLSAFFVQQLSPSQRDMKQEQEVHILPDLFGVRVTVTAQPSLHLSCCCLSDSHCRSCCLPAWRQIKSWQCLLTAAGILFPFSTADNHWSSSSLSSEQLQTVSCIFPEALPQFSLQNTTCMELLRVGYI